MYYSLLYFYKCLTRVTIIFIVLCVQMSYNYCIIPCYLHYYALVSLAYNLYYFMQKIFYYFFKDSGSTDLYEGFLVKVERNTCHWIVQKMYRLYSCVTLKSLFPFCFDNCVHKFIQYVIMLLNLYMYWCKLGYMKNK